MYFFPRTAYKYTWHIIFIVYEIKRTVVFENDRGIIDDKEYACAAMGDGGNTIYFNAQKRK